MNRIRLLPDHVANQIAAGEVVERPASVVKELVENSLDAGATRIEIETRHGGRSLIRVSDNGCGMSKDDALLSLERHATSKVATSEDIENIRTLGFRGEAIPSIAAVCRFHMITREAESPSGTEISISGGKLHEVKEIGTPAGTTVEVRNLFFNLPARRKFMRSPPTEMAHISHIVTLHALAHSRVAFWLKQDDHVVVDVAPGKNLLDRIRELYGAQLCQELLPVTSSKSRINITGFVGKPGVSRADRSQQHMFVNGRPVDSKSLSYGVLEGYHTALMRGRYPVTFLFVETDPAIVDVNIHPAKREVRFHDEREARLAIVEAVRIALEKNVQASERPSVGASGLHAWPVRPSDAATPQVPHFDAPRSDAPTLPAPTLPAPTLPAPTLDTPTFDAPPSGSAALHAPRSTLHASSALHEPFGLRLLGVVGDLYVIAESAEGLVLVDQHAAHERVLFEQMLKRNETQPVPSQRLLLPETIEVDHRDMAFLRENLETIQSMGIGLSEFGERVFVIDSLPPFIRKANIRQMVRNIVDELREAGREVPRGRLSEAAVATTVCRHAVKAHDPLKTAELIQLLHDLHQCDLRYTCPHGRPTMILLSYNELEKKFGRRV